MKLMVPTLYVQAMLAQPLDLGETQFKAGEIIKMPYGTALQAYTMGVVRAIQDADKMHEEASKMLMEYGPDAWFPQPLQTLAKVVEHTDKNVVNAPSSALVH